MGTVFIPGRKWGRSRSRDEDLVAYAAKAGTIIRRTASEMQRVEMLDQLRAGADLSDLDWSELVNIEPLEIDDADQLEMEITAFVGAVRSGSRPAIDAEAGFVNVRTAQRIVAATKEFIASLEPFTTH